MNYLEDYELPFGESKETLRVYNIEQIKDKLDEVKEEYDKYKELTNKLEECIKKIKTFETKDKDHHLVLKLDGLKVRAFKYGLRFEDLKDTQELFESNPEVKEYYYNTREKEKIRSNINEVYEFYCDNFGEYVLLNQGNKKFLLDLYSLGKLDVTDYDKDFLEFIKNSIDKKMLEITPDDLPVLMAIKEEIDYKEKDRINYYDVTGSDYLIRSDIPHQIKLEFIRSKMTDDKCTKRDDIVNRMPFILDTNKQAKMMQELEKQASTLTKEEYLTKYYEMKMLFGNNIEKMYLEADEENKKYIIDAYYNSSIQAFYDKKHFRTASPIINMELLKEKYKVKVR